MIPKTFCIGYLFAAVLSAQQMQKLDPAANHLFSDSSKLERIATGFNKWTEGPVWTSPGALFFAEIPANNIIRWSADKGAAVFLHPSGYTGASPYKGPEPGSNGMTLDAAGRLTVAGHARRIVWRLESLDASARITVLADKYEGKRLSSPNDLVYKSDGSLYFTDPPYGLETQSDEDPHKELKVNGVYRILHAATQKPGAPPDAKNLQLLIGDLPRPNGIAFSPDEKVLYVSDSGRRVWMRYSVAADGTVHDGTVFQEAGPDKTHGGPDGIKVDVEGNLYGSGPGGIWIMSPAGKHIATIDVPEVAANLAWGDADRKTLYITASTSVYRVRLNVKGKP